MYVPSLRVFRNRSSEVAQDDAKEAPPEKILLYLPSSLPNSVEYDRRLLEIEWKLRHAQCTDALDDLRDSIRLRSYIYIDKRRFQRGQKANTCSRSILMRCDEKVTAAADRYRAGRGALLNLSPLLDKVGWQSALRVLLHEDTLGMSIDSEDTRNKKRKRSSNRPSEGHRTVSWIWMGMSPTAPGSAIDEGLHDSMYSPFFDCIWYSIHSTYLGLRIEWCKSRARRDRWTEEVQLLREEMRRVVESLEHWANEWDLRAQDAAGWSLPGVPVDESVDEGRISFARQQANQFRVMKDYCLYRWRFVAEYINMGGENVALFTVDDFIVSGEEDSEDPLPSMAA